MGRVRFIRPTSDGFYDHREIRPEIPTSPCLTYLVCETECDTGRAAVWLGEIADCYYQKALHRLRPMM